jgi:hypothetical protein
VASAKRKKPTIRRGRKRRREREREREGWGSEREGTRRSGKEWWRSVVTVVRPRSVLPTSSSVVVVCRSCRGNGGGPHSTVGALVPCVRLGRGTRDRVRRGPARGHGGIPGRRSDTRRVASRRGSGRECVAPCDPSEVKS